MRMTCARWAAAALFGALLLAPAPAAERDDKVRAEATEARLRKDVGYLASKDLEGRGPTTKGIDKAADHIAAEFKRLGLKPGGGKNTGYFQPFTVPATRLEGEPTLVFKGPKGQEIKMKAGDNFQPFGLSSSGGLKDVPVVFAGYGVIGSGEKFKYNDYDGIKASGSVVVLLRDTPRPGDRKADIDGQRRQRHASFTQKMNNAEKQGALGVLFANDHDTAKDGDDLLDFNFTCTARMPEAKLPAMMIKRDVLQKMLGDTKLTDIEAGIDKDLKPASQELKDWTVSLEIKTKRDTWPAKNVVGILEGAGPLADETVVIGAHYDHLGYGGGGSLAGLKKMAIHHGADDNASGTSAVLELARRFAEQKERKGRRLVFILFSCEEMGLLGSEHYCKHPSIPLENTVAMVNLDMVGRLTKDAKTNKEKLQVHGTGTAKGFSELIDGINKKYDFQLSKVAGGIGPSDHASFYKQKIPVFFFFTGDHREYHRPTDTADTINYDGLRRVMEMAQDVSTHLALADKRPEYLKVDSPTRVGGGGPRLGFAPDYGDDGEGVLVGAVTEGMPAAKGGIKTGDRIVEIAGKPVKTLEGYMVEMAKQKLGTTIDVGVMRDKKKTMFKIKLE